MTCNHSFLLLEQCANAGGPVPCIACANCDQVWTHVSGSVYQAKGQEEGESDQERREDPLPQGTRVQ